MNKNAEYTFNINGNRNCGDGDSLMSSDQQMEPADGTLITFDETDPYDEYDDEYSDDEDCWYDDGPNDDSCCYDPWSEGFWSDGSIMAEYERLTGGSTADEWQAFQTVAIYDC